MNTRRIRWKLTSIRLCLPLIIIFSTSTGVMADTIDDLNLDVARSKAILMSMHKKAKKALVNAAQDRTFNEYFTTHDDDHKHELKKKIDNISLNVQNNFHVEEMCLIDPEGSEISRIVGSEIAHDLSNEEASADFFKPSFEQRPRSVYQSPVYISPDVDKWVVAYVTPVVAENQKKAILHYEHGLDVFQNALSKVAGPADKIKLVVTDEGWIIWDQQKSINVDKIARTEKPSAYFEFFKFGGKNINEIVNAIDVGSPIRGDNGELYLGAYRQVSDWFILALKASHTAVVSQAED